MSYNDLLNDSCSILKKSVNNTGMTDTESWVEGQPVPCRLLTNSATLYNPEKSQHATVIRSKFALRNGENVAIRDRIKHAGRVYDVVAVPPVRGQRRAHHTVAICEAITGDV